MKNVYILILISFFFIHVGFSQLRNGVPFGFDNNINENIDVITLDKPDVEALKTEDLDRDKNGQFYRVGVAINANLNFSNSGEWIELDNGKLWRVKIIIPDALALSVDFDNYWIPEGAKIFIYNETKSEYTGALTSEDNVVSKKVPTDIIHSDNIIIEYFEPYNASRPGSFEIYDIAYLYRGISSNSKDFGTSDPCEVNVNCPEGNNWQAQKRGVAKIFLRVDGSYGYCTGSLINNQRQDCSTYFLTADHCGQGATTADLNWWKFYFAWESDSCNNPATSPSYDYTYGCAYKASGGNGGNSGSDFYLVTLNRTSYTTDWNLFFNGWDRSIIASGGGVSIHHPDGDIMKISTYNNTPQSSSWGSATGSHWRVYWSPTVTDHGVTEGGSSGSPLFNSAGRIIGDLTGGSSYCTSPNWPDYYGKFSYSWVSNGTTSDKQLKPWLDPDDTGISVLNGLEYSDCSLGLNEKNNENIIELFPNPANNNINIKLKGINANRTVQLKIYNSIGKMVYSSELEISHDQFQTINTASFDNGMYSMLIFIEDQFFSEQFIIIK